MLEKLPEVGEKVRYLGGECEKYSRRVTVGEIYEVIVSDEEEAIIKTHDGAWHIYGDDHPDGSDFDKYELVEESKGLTELPKVGEIVRCIRRDSLSQGDVTVGEEHEVIAINKLHDVSMAVINGDDGDWYIYGAGHKEGNDFDKYELVTKIVPKSVPSIVANTEAVVSKEVSEIIANLARRVWELEKESDKHKREIERLSRYHEVGGEHYDGS